MGAATFFAGLSAIAGEGDGRTDIGATFFEAKRATLTAGLAEQSLSTLSLSAGAAVPTAEAVYKAEEEETGPAPRVRV